MVAARWGKCHSDQAFTSQRAVAGRMVLNKGWGRSLPCRPPEFVQWTAALDSWWQSCLLA